MKTAPSITAIIPVLDRPKELQRLLSSLAILDYPGELSISIVDDGSQRPYDEIAGEFCRNNPGVPVALIRHPKRQGPAICRNRALHDAKSEYVWFLDSDTEVTRPDLLQNAMSIFAANPNVKAVGEEIFLFDNAPYTAQYRWCPNFLFTTTYQPIEEAGQRFRSSIATANLIVKRAALQEVGYFDPRFKLLEDNDLCLRLRKKGYELVSAPEVGVYHHVSPHGRVGSIEPLANLVFYAYLIQVSRIRLVFKHRRELLPFLPLLDLVYGLQVASWHFSTEESRAVFSKKLDRQVAAPKFLAIQLAGLLAAYVRLWALPFEALYENA